MRFKICLNENLDGLLASMNFDAHRRIAANQVATARLRRPTNGRAPALIRGSPAPLSVLEAAAVPRQLGTKCDGSDRRRKIDEGSRRKGEGAAILDCALDNRPSTGRGNGRPAVSPTSQAP